MNFKKIIILITVFLFTILTMYSEDTDSELIKKKKQNFKNYLRIAKSSNPIAKINLLDRIMNEYDEMKYSEEDIALVEIVVFLSEEGVLRKEYENQRLVNDFYDVRLKSVILLTKLGGDKARMGLINLLYYEKNNSVIIAILQGLSVLGDTSKNEALNAIMVTYRNISNPSQDYMLALIYTLRDIVKGNSKVYNDVLILLTEIRNRDLKGIVKEAAYEVMMELSKED